MQWIKLIQDPPKTFSQRILFPQASPWKKLSGEEIVIWSNNLGKCCIAHAFLRDSLAHYHVKDADKSEFGSQEILLKNYTHTPRTAVWYIYKLLRGLILNVPIKRKRSIFVCIYMIWRMLTKLTVIITSWYSLSSH